MSDEIKVVQTDVMNALAELQSVSQSLGVDYSAIDTGGNVLEMAEMLVEINLSFSEVLKSYQELLLHNEVATKEAVETLRQTEAQIASQMDIMK